MNKFAVQQKKIELNGSPKLFKSTENLSKYVSTFKTKSGLEKLTEEKESHFDGPPSIPSALDVD